MLVISIVNKRRDRFGTGELLAGVAQITGVGGLGGTGALNAGSSVVAGDGLSSSTGTGAIVSQAAAASGTDAGPVTGTGALVAQASVVSGAGNVPITTSYANTGGTGNRTALITVTSTATISSGTLSNLVDGGFVSNSTDSMFWTNGQSSKTLTFDFGTAVYITEAKHYSSTAASHGTWKWRGSNDNTNWTDLSANFTFSAGSEGFVMGDLSANQTAYRYYQLFQVSGTTSSNPWQQEWEFKIFGL